MDFPIKYRRCDDGTWSASMVVNHPETGAKMLVGFGRRREIALADLKLDVNQFIEEVVEHAKKKTEAAQPWTATEDSPSESV